MSFCALILAFILGVIFGAMSSSKNKILRAIARVYVEVFQNTPLLVQFVFVYYGLAIMTNGAIMISTFFTAVLCVGIYHGAYIAEVIRSGIELPKGQTEAAFHRIYLQPNDELDYFATSGAYNLATTLLTAVSNQNTSTVAIISGADIMFTAKAWAYEQQTMCLLSGAALLYFSSLLPLATWARHKEEENKNHIHSRRIKCQYQYLQTLASSSKDCG